MLTNSAQGQLFLLKGGEWSEISNVSEAKLTYTTITTNTTSGLNAFTPTGGGSISTGMHGQPCFGTNPVPVQGTFDLTLDLDEWAKTLGLFPKRKPTEETRAELDRILEACA